MSFGIQAPPLAQNIRDTKAASPEDAVAAAATKKEQDAHKVGGDFEAILVRQMLSKAKIGGEGAYGDMAVEAMANAVTKGGGIGLGRVIENQLAPHHDSVKTSSAAATTTPSQAAAAFKKLQVPATSGTPSKI